MFFNWKALINVDLDELRKRVRHPNKFQVFVLKYLNRKRKLERVSSINLIFIFHAELYFRIVFTLSHLFLCQRSTFSPYCLSRHHFGEVGPQRVNITITFPVFANLISGSNDLAGSRRIAVSLIRHLARSRASFSLYIFFPASINPKREVCMEGEGREDVAKA